MADATLTPDAAFARAAALGLPVFLYWGAAWCPPCNRIRATVFDRADFQALAPSCVPLQIDGDSAGAQQLAERFHVRSYPTLIVFRPDGTEITRLPCELDGERFVEIFQLALHARRSVAESLGTTLSDDEWHLLSFYSWDTDEGRLPKDLDFASLARACPVPEAALRLQWHAMAGKAGIDQRAAIAQIEATLGDADTVRAQLDIVTNLAVDLVRLLTAANSPARFSLTHAWATALQRLEIDPSVNPADQLAALRARVRMARLGQPVDRLDGILRERVASALAEPSGPALRHQIVNTAAGMLSDAGLLDEAERVLQDELAHSPMSFFFMHSLAAIARKRGAAAGAVEWYERAWDSAVGPATRLQWGATYLQGLVDAAPDDVPRIERCASRMLDELKHISDAGCQRNRTQLERIDSKLALWNGAGTHVSALHQAVRAALQK